MFLNPYMWLAGTAKCDGSVPGIRYRQAKVVSCEKRFRSKVEVSVCLALQQSAFEEDKWLSVQRDTCFYHKFFNGRLDR